jgi:hypothetical protein
MTTDVLRLPGDYKIITATTASGDSTGGIITLDVSPQSGGTKGTVIINGNLTVIGTQTNLITTDSAIEDRTITLNAGEPWKTSPGGITGSNGNQTSGLKISRGVNGLDNDQYAAFFEWNDAAHWQGTGAISNVQGLWEFRIGRTGNPRYSGIKINAIRIDENSASTNGTGVGQGARLSVFGSDNPTAVISVSGTNNYESRVTDDDDIPNKKYVDNLLLTANYVTSKIQVGNSYVTLQDQYNDGVVSEVVAVLDGDPTQRLNINTGTVVMRLTAATAQFQGVQFSGNTIDSVGANQDLKLTANGTGQIRIQRPLIFTIGDAPTPAAGETGLYVAAPGGGGTGVYFKSKDLVGVVKGDEFMSRKKALVYSIIFG